MSSMVQKLTECDASKWKRVRDVLAPKSDLSQDNLYLWPDHRIIRGDQNSIHVALTWNFVTKVQQTFTRTRREEV